MQLKDLGGRTVGEKVTVWDGKVVRELEGLPVGRACFAGTRDRCQLYEYYCTSVQLVKDYL